MSDDFPIPGNLRANRLPGSPAATAPANTQAKGGITGYQSGQEVERQARVSKPMDDPEFRHALDRLNQAVDSPKPFRRDVPRGFYLNIRV